MMGQDQIRALEARLQAAMLHGNVTELEELLADDLVFVSQNGQIFGKSDDLAVHRAGRQRIESLDISEMQTILSDALGIVVVKAQVAGRFDGQPFSGAFRYSRVWLLREGRWQVVNAHCSAIVGM